MNIIFTRPLIDSEDLMMNFFKSGYKVIHMPTLSITSAKMESINTEDYDGLIFTSANAVRFLKIKNEDEQIWFLRFPITLTEKLGTCLKLFRDQIKGHRGRYLKIFQQAFYMQRKG